MASLFRSHKRNYLSVFLLLSSCPGIYGNIRTENAKITIDEDATRPEVNIPQGTVRGMYNVATLHGRHFLGFKGIPYAQPPIGNLRFEAPLPAGAWNGTLDASNDPNSCPQVSRSNKVVNGHEDCLYLNVYTPRLPKRNDTKLLPVMVFLHGGAFKHGNNNADQLGPHFLLDKDVILVLPQYRLGLFGFLSTGDEVVPGNNGLKDLVKALEWNQKNIQYFGGDPDQVTVFGESAGAISVHLLTISRLANGLFHKYITESGSALSYDAYRPRTVLKDRTNRVAEHLGCPTHISMALINCLRLSNVSELLRTDSLFHLWSEYPVVIWSPTIEPDIEGAFLTERPASHFATGRISTLPWLSSINREEGLVYVTDFYRRPDLFADFLSQIDAALPPMLTYDTLVDDVQAYTDALKSYYLNDLTANRTLLLKNLTQLVGDAMFAFPTHSATEKQFVHRNSPHYVCSFEYRGTFSYTDVSGNGARDDYGVSHADDLIYLFHKSFSRYGYPDGKLSKADLKVVDEMVQLWTSFAITGTPTPLNPNSTPIWEPYSSRKNYIRIGNSSDTSIGVEYNFLEDRMRFWEELTAATAWK